MTDSPAKQNPFVCRPGFEDSRETDPIRQTKREDRLGTAYSVRTFLSQRCLNRPCTSRRQFAHGSGFD
jgi:hypothetical protein